jgi:hypothetical protein
VGAAGGCDSWARHARLRTPDKLAMAADRMNEAIGADGIYSSPIVKRL